MRYDEAWLEHLHQSGQLSAERLAALRQFAEGVEVLVHDMGVAPFTPRRQRNSCVS